MVDVSLQGGQAGGPDSEAPAPETPLSVAAKLGRSSLGLWWTVGAALAAIAYAVAWQWPDDAGRIESTWSKGTDPTCEAWTDHGARGDKCRIQPGLEVCAAQYCYRQCERRRRWAAFWVSDRRLQTLRGFERSDDERIQRAPVYANLRDELAKEQQNYDQLRFFAHELDVDRSVRDVYVTLLVASGVFVPLLLVWMLAVSFERRLRISSGTLAARSSVLLPIFVAVQFAPHVLGELYSSAWRVEKLWFGSDSWCVSRERFLLVLLMVLGTQVCIGCALVAGWNSSSRDLLPEVDLQHVAGRCGVGGYLDVLQQWVLRSLGLTSFAVVCWMLLVSRTSEFRLYGLRLFPQLVMLVVLYFRYAYRILDLRRTYAQKRAALGKIWSKIEAEKVPPDPTANVIGANVWSLGPATLALFGVVWSVIKALGLDAKLGSW